MLRIKKLYFILWAMFSFSVHAEPFDYQYHIDWLPSYSHKVISGNNYLDRKTNFFTSDLRADTKVNYDFWQLVLRPRLISDYQTDSRFGANEYYFLGSITEGFASAQVTEKISLSIGRQSYQWGPAELVSWSNSLFHFNYDYRSFFYRENGKYLAKFSYSPSKNVSWVLMGEALNSHLKSDYEDSLHNVKYKTKGLLKGEVVFDKASDYLGITFASGEEKSHHLGFYGAYGVNEKISLYTDSRLSFGSSYYDMTNVGVFKTWHLKEDQQSKIRPLVSIGTRLEESYDLRFEYIYNSLGFNGDQLKDVLASTRATNPYALYNLLILSKNGRELLGRHYFYTSLRLPNMGANESITYYVRHFYSLQDHSFTIQLNAEKNLTDSLVGYLETDTAVGKQDSELRFQNDFVGHVGVKWSY
jgi:hypothetical protein